MKERRSKNKNQYLPLLQQRSSKLPNNNVSSVSSQPYIRIFVLLVIIGIVALLLPRAVKVPLSNIDLEIHPYPSRLQSPAKEKERVAALVQVLLDKIKTEYSGPTDVLGPLDSILQWTKSVNDNHQIDVLPSSLPSDLYPQFMAVRWLALDDMYISKSENEDAKAAAASAREYSTLLQRYALSVLYFATGGDESWDHCSRRSSVTSCEGDTMNVQGLGRRFLSNSYECDWEGITCNRKNDMLWIELTSNNLSSNEQAADNTPIIPAELVLLSNKIELLWLSSNPNLYGTIPNYIGEFTKLETLNIFDTGLSGTIPDSLYKLKKLNALRLYNTSLKGTISSQMGSMKKLAWLWLHGSQLTGSIPSELGNLGNLNALTLHGNNFDNDNMSDFPQEVCLLRKKKNLAHLWTDCIEEEKKGNRGQGDEDVKHTCSCCTRCLARSD